MKNHVYILAVCLFALGFASLGTPSRALAATTYHLTCADFTLYSGATCSSDVVGVTGSGDLAITSLPFTSATWYGSWTATAGNYRYACASNGTCGDNHVSGSFVAQPMAFAVTPGFSFLGDGSAVSISDICVTDTAGDCETGPPPAPPTPSIDFAHASTTIIADPNRDFFFGLLLFLFGFIIIIWLFKGRH